MTQHAPEQRARGSMNMVAALGVVAIVIVAAIVLLTMSRGTGDETAAARAGASPSLTASPAGTATSRTASVAPSSSSASPRGEFVSAKHGYAVTLPEPYHPSTLSRDFGADKHPAAVDYFTVLASAEEAAGSQGCGIDTANTSSCPAQNGAGVALIFTDAGSMTPRQWFDAGNTPRSPGRLTDATIAGRPALKIEPSGKYELMYVVADGKGRMYHLTYELFHIAPAPPGASREKLDQLLMSFRFVS